MCHVTQSSHENNRGVMSSNTGSSKKGQNETLTELTDEFYKGEEEPESTGHTALQSDSQAIYISYLGEDVEEIPASLCRNHGSIARRLDLSYNRLRSLRGLSSFVCLEELILDNNNLNDNALLEIPHMPKLHTLTLNKNKVIDTAQLLETLCRECPKLRYLSLLGNIACPNELLGSGHDDEDYQRYRYFVLYKLPNLTFLDSRSVTETERKEARRVGKFMKVVRPADDEVPTHGGGAAVASQYTPLPESSVGAGDHMGTFGQCKYVYYGKHSEGNRFIRNHEL